MLSSGVDKDAVSSFSFFLSSYFNFVASFFSAENYVFFRSSFLSHGCFFQNFLKDVFGRKFLFPWGRNGDAKVVFFLAGSFSRNREVFESDGLIRRFFFFPDMQMLMRKSDVFEVGPDT